MCTFVKHTLPQIIFFKFIKVKNLRTIDTYLSFQIAYSRVDRLPHSTILREITFVKKGFIYCDFSFLFCLVNKFDFEISLS